MSFIHKHKPHLIIWTILLVIVGVSGYIAFGTKTNQKSLLLAPHSQVQVDTQSNKTTTTGTFVKTHKKNIKTLNKRLQTTLTENKKIKNSSQKPLTTTTQKNQTLNSEQTVTANTTTPVYNITLQVDNKKYRATITKPISVYQLMQKLKKTNHFTFTGTDYGSGMGFFVKTINGKANNTHAGTYWIFFVNGKKSTRGVSTKIIHKGDIISWAYEKDTSD